MWGSFFNFSARYSVQCQCLIILFFCLKTVGYSAVVVADTKHFDLILAGGSLSTCSSMSIKNCRNNDFDEHELTQLKYAFGEKSAAKFLQMAEFWPQNNALFSQLHAVLVQAYANESQHQKSRNEFLDGLVAHGFSERDIRALPDSVYFALLDTHEVRQLDPNGNRKQERAVVEWNKSLASRAVYQTFVDQSSLRAVTADRPRIAVVTASSRDAFESADFYISAFESMGADVVWLPLDASFQYARWLTQWGTDGCTQLTQISAQFFQFDRERVYPKRSQLHQQYCQQPELLNDLLNQVHGVFFNGGDQSRTLAALLTPDGQVSEQLAIIQRRVAAGELVVGGTSAGTAVQAGGFYNQRPIPMITNGHSRNALTRGAIPVGAPSSRCSGDCQDGLLSDELTYRPQGGTGLFNLGLLDTHFSERDREARLIAFADAAQQRFAFGVDETTALLVDYHTDGVSLGVVGEAGVFVVDRANGLNNLQLNQVASVKAKQLSGTAHFLLPEMQLEFTREAQNWRVTSTLTKTTKRKKLSALDDGEWRNQTRQWCGSQKQLNWSMEGYSVLVKADEQTQFFVGSDVNSRHCGYVGLPFVLHHSE